ncbi:MAG: type II secretion system protein GspG, partial [Acidobacteria bacterium]|nr:type II secretion system protein GspG [Acidobacteriota bacterium]
MILERAAKVLSNRSSIRADKPHAPSNYLSTSEPRNPISLWTLWRQWLLALSLALICLFPLRLDALAKGELGAKEARNLIRRAAGLELPSGAVRVRAITPSGSTEAVVVAQIETAFRFERDDEDRWRIAEIRTGDRRWEDVDLLVRAARGEISAGSSPEGSASPRSRAVVNLDAILAREMIARLAGIELPSDAVRVKEISSLYKSAVVVAQVITEFRFVRGSDNKWRVAGVRTGDGEWTDIERTLRIVNEEKARRARAELEMIAAALDSFRRERGFYVVADSSSTLLDQLNPRYLPRVIRLDPWQRPFLYEGERDRYLLRSAGADGETGTADDINVSSRGQTVG